MADTEETRSTKFKIRIMHTVNKGATIQHKGKIVWWCPSHKHKDGIFNGLYVWQKPEDHDSWFEKFKSHIKTTAAPTVDPPAGSKQGSLDKLMVSRHLREVLCSNLMVSDADAN